MKKYNSPKLKINLKNKIIDVFGMVVFFFPLVNFVYQLIFGKSKIETDTIFIAILILALFSYLGTVCLYRFFNGIVKVHFEDQFIIISYPLLMKKMNFQLRDLKGYSIHENFGRFPSESLILFFKNEKTIELNSRDIKNIKDFKSFFKKRFKNLGECYCIKGYDLKRTFKLMKK
ncbi:hypothetical protein BTO06_15735 [Tenacibaculum sp. SZ-18]|uniref:hypothetical protein n=1 Tax=Tenacibaculum sp. SZ-18 TaxID=754423 RepID=UPI000C2D0540|nr:hypothetical protein [Tenacibaculum sp. SZ-18]AUC16512.1 hypothetical protein BTO06_15735 [Tenacibaculum sp. SZ-18]